MADSREEMLLKMVAAIAGLTDAQLALMNPLLYAPDPRLGLLLNEADAELQKKAKGELSKEEVQKLGYTLERVCVLVFRGLVGIESIQSYRSAGPQLDLLVTGRETYWALVCKGLSLPGAGGILVEAKAKGEKVGDPDFQRLGNIITHHFGSSAAIGVFFAVAGASGFETSDRTRTSLTAARLTQALVYYSGKKPIVVLDWDDIKGLDKAGALIDVLCRRVREIEEMSGVKQSLFEAPVKVVLPEHLKDLCDFANEPPVNAPPANEPPANDPPAS